MAARRWIGKARARNAVNVKGIVALPKTWGTLPACWWVISSWKRGKRSGKMGRVCRKEPSGQKAFWTQQDDDMGFPCFKLRPSHSSFTRNILADQLTCPACIGVRLHKSLATHHDLAKRTVARLGLTFFKRHTEPHTWITSKVLHMTTLWPAGQVKDPLFPEEPDRNHARESSGIQRRQVRGNRQIQYVCHFLVRQGAGRRWGVVGGHVSSPQVRCQSLFLMTSLPGYCTPCLWLNIHCPTHLVPHTPAQASRGVSPKSRELREVKGTKTVYTAWSTFTRNRSRWARPNIWRFRNLSRFTWPSVVTWHAFARVSQESNTSTWRSLSRVTNSWLKR